MSPTLHDRLRAHAGDHHESGVDQFFERYGLTRNPFPPARTILAEVVYDQDEAIERFAQAVDDVTKGGPARRALAIVAGTGGGKTHILRHFQFEFRSLCKEQDKRFAVLEFQAGSGKFQTLARDVFEAADQACRDAGSSGFVTALVDALRNEKGNVLEDIGSADLREALRVLVNAREPTHQPTDRAGRFDFETLRALFWRWLEGGTLDQTERKYLRVFGRIGTGSMAARVLSESIALARKLKVLDGILLCLDEVETLFGGALSTSAFQSFLQDLRYMFDESTGYSLLLVSAATPTGAQNLAQANGPVFQRLGLEAPSRVELRPIEGSDDAKKFANAYIEFERARAKTRRGTSTPILSDADIQRAFQAAGRTGRAFQAPLLEALHRAVEDKRGAESR